MFCNQSEEEGLLHPDQNQTAKKNHPSINREIFSSGSRCFRAVQMLSEEHIIYPREYACSPLENPCLLKPANQNPETELQKTIVVQLTNITISLPQFCGAAFLHLETLPLLLLTSSRRGSELKPKAKNKREQKWGGRNEKGIAVTHSPPVVVALLGLALVGRRRPLLQKLLQIRATLRIPNQSLWKFEE
jgi:hypothetical protein